MEKVSEEIIKLREKSAVLVISHDYEFIRHVADNIVYLDDGKIQKEFELNSDSVKDLNSIFNKMKKDSEDFELLKKEA